MKKRLVDLDFATVHEEAQRAWSDAANRALRAGVEAGGHAEPDKATTKTSRTAPKAGKSSVKAA